MSDLSCVCKPNVEQESGNCTHCLPDFYGIRQTDGCLPCECDDVGTNDVIPRICDVNSGQCPCKQYVTGRKPGTEITKRFTRSPQPSMKLFLLINVKNANNCWHFNILC